MPGDGKTHSANPSCERAVVRRHRILLVTDVRGQVEQVVRRPAAPA
jgi:hypothetical protein